MLCRAAGISNELIESARLDGAGDGRIFTRILLPLIKPQIELATMFTLLNGENLRLRGISDRRRRLPGKR